MEDLRIAYAELLLKASSFALLSLKKNEEFVILHYIAYITLLKITEQNNYRHKND
jgi:hypothetical protein